MPYNFELTISNYLEHIRIMNTEQSRSHYFSCLLSNLFGLDLPVIDSYFSGIETTIATRNKDRLLKGRADNLFGNVILEFERVIPNKLNEAIEQLKRYVCILWTNEISRKKTSYVCIAGDGVNFIVFSPIITNQGDDTLRPDDISLNVISKVNFEKYTPNEVYYWLDRYFLRKEILRPTSNSIVLDFGINSHTFKVISNDLISEWKSVRGISEYSVLYDTWKKYLLVVYGGDVSETELFIRHTYLSILAKLLVWILLANEHRGEDLPVEEILNGEFFKQRGIQNFIEEDFFSWPVRSQTLSNSKIILIKIVNLLNNYNISLLSEDILKCLYQDLIDPITRHDLGEFYTPDWLAHSMIKTTLKFNPEASILDPSCGSGTFLYLVIREKRFKLGNTLENLEHILCSVVGIDIHPLAVIIAKTNFLLGLSDLLSLRKKDIYIPVYLADSIKLPQRWMQSLGSDFRIEVEGQELFLDEKLVNNSVIYDTVIEIAKEFALRHKGTDVSVDQFENFLGARSLNLANELLESVFRIVKFLKNFIDSDRDGIWGYILKNIFKPFFLKDKFDVVLGNPPWLAYRYMDTDYRTSIKEFISDKYRIVSGHGELITHFEMATLFLVRAADLYLKEGGIIGFVLPKSIFYADQHHGLRNRSFNFWENPEQTLQWLQLWDCEQVSPLFTIPSCVLFAKKVRSCEIISIPGTILRGKLEQKNCSFDAAKNVIEFKRDFYYLNSFGNKSFWGVKKAPVKKQSYYKDKFSQGAALVPRTFWFVQINQSGLGLDYSRPPIKSINTNKGGPIKAYKDIIIKGNIESRFLFATILGDDLLPFTYRNIHLVTLPIEENGDSFKIVNEEDARSLGYYDLSDWLNRVQTQWDNCRISKEELILKSLNYRNKLTNQNPRAKFKVIYPNFQRISLSAVIDVNEVKRFYSNNLELELSNLIIDSSMYYFETDNADEAHYVCSFLNSPEINTRLSESFRKKDQKSHPNVHKKVFDVASIPLFDPKNIDHKNLTRLGYICEQKAKSLLAKTDACEIGKLRLCIRKSLSKELMLIDKLTSKILNTSG